MPSSTPKRSVADELLAKGAITKDEHRRAVDVANADGEPVEEVLIELGFVAEGDLLRHVAEQHGVRYADSEKLAGIKLDRHALDKVPAELARRLGLCPARLDEPTGRLMVLSAAPGDKQAVEELMEAAQVDDVTVVMVRPAALRAAWAAGYEGDLARLKALTSSTGRRKKADFSSTLRSAGGMDELLADIVGSAPEAKVQLMMEEDEPAPPSRPAESAADAARQPADASVAKAGPGSAGRADLGRSGASGPPGPAGGSAGGTSLPAMAAMTGQSIAIGSLPPPPARLSIGPVARGPRTVAPGAVDDAFMRALRVFVGLLEGDRGELRGHSAFVARLTEDACQRVRLPPEDTAAIITAAYLHDLGKAGNLASSTGARRSTSPASHLTPLNVAKFKVFRQLARDLVDVPVQLMESVGLAPATRSALQTMYERVDGKGIPKGLTAEDIPMGGRILAVADCYADLTRNSHNTVDRLLAPEKAMAVLSDHAGKVFDPNVVAVFSRAMAGERIAEELLDERHRALLIDPDVEHTLVLQLRLVDEGLDVHVVRSFREARAALDARAYALVVSEIDLATKEQGLELCESVSETAAGRSATWVFLARRQTKDLVRRAFRAGAADFIAKPVSVDILAAKLLELAERSRPDAEETPATSRGVAGSLADMALTDVVQILWHGQRTGALILEWPGRRGEVHFENGQIVHATFADAVGEVALYRLLDLGSKDEEGQFRVDPTFVPAAEHSIDASPEALMLEAMRLIDEDIVP